MDRIVEDLALSNDEAADVMGVQRSVPRKMLRKGEIVGRDMLSDAPDIRRTPLFSFASCNANYEQYLEDVALGLHLRRPRTRLDARQPALAHLAICSPRIMFTDAVNVGEAARLIGTDQEPYSPTGVRKLVSRGKLQARFSYSLNTKTGLSKTMILSKTECLRYARKIKTDQLLGRKPGRAIAISDADLQRLTPQLLQTHSDGAAAAEGARKTRLVQRPDRNPQLIAQKKRFVMQRDGGRLCCEVCDFDFIETYGTRGIGFAECHHQHPIAHGERLTKVKDLRIVCANCHRMLEREPKISVEELRKIVIDHRRGLHPKDV